ncbi:MAG: ribonuclease Z [Candidatus Neomarinimicrobiota bacterium]|nr:ribonuclease Z [Candidatus Neomarinimicrobiota bacterium]
MKLTILGSASHIPTRDRNQNGYFLETAEEALLFDPGEGTQRQFTLAGISPGRVKRIFISHFHGDHCLGLPGMMQRLSLMQVSHPLKIYFPEEGREFIQALSKASKFTAHVEFEFHPLKAGFCEENEKRRIEAYELRHSTPVLGYRIIEKPRLHFIPERLRETGLEGGEIALLEKSGKIRKKGKTIRREDLSYRDKGKIFAYALDTAPCPAIPGLIRDADCLLMEGTYLRSEQTLADTFLHMCAEQAGEYARDHGVKKLVLTHYSERYKDMGAYQKAVVKVFENTHIAKDFDVIEF